EPYDRPPLSKQLLSGEWGVDDLRLPVDVAALAVEWERGHRAPALDRAAREVERADGRRLAYDGLVLATGAVPRHLPGGRALAGVHVLRTLDDCLAIKADLAASPGRGGPPPLPLQRPRGARRRGPPGADGAHPRVRPRLAVRRPAPRPRGAGAPRGRGGGARGGGAGGAGRAGPRIGDRRRRGGRGHRGHAVDGLARGLGAGARQRRR